MADDFTCPLGGQWYACASSSRFVGCCESDPCSTGCAQGNMRQAGFNVSNYGKFPDASCGLASNFYTCSSGRTFWGCCKSAPCSDEPTCPDGALVPAFMERPEQFNFYAASQTGTGTESTSSSLSSNNGSSKSNGAVIGGAVGGAIGGVLIIGLIVFFLFRRRRRQQTTSRGTVDVASPMMDGKGFDHSSSNFVAQSPPPTYSATNGDYYQSMETTGKVNPYTQSPYSQGQWAHTADGPQEMEAEVGPSNRYSELPAEASRPGTHHRYSELSTGPSCRVSPQHSPKPSQTETDLETKPKGLGVVTEGERV
ncbi:hypothetical protein EKO04_003147 [Ascochyta lentis]|uniref:Uncharacterized protein n=1 Tax=Ascochyta lentis TaxID=205686 RepID=A0A8H7J8T1_9PLEO|nr:hypothetical protein EKO04_003147 [Ascochyta lentis]